MSYVWNADWKCNDGEDCLDLMMLSGALLLIKIMQQEIGIARCVGRGYILNFGYLCACCVNGMRPKLWTRSISYILDILVMFTLGNPQKTSTKFSNSILGGAHIFEQHATTAVGINKYHQTKRGTYILDANQIKIFCPKCSSHTEQVWRYFLGTSHRLL